MSKIDYEIFEKWWEYFLVAKWSFYRPSNEKLTGLKIVTYKNIEKKYSDKLKKLFDEPIKENIEQLQRYSDEEFYSETERKNVIEAKAHSLLGQSGISVTLLIAALSLGTTQFGDWSILFKLLLWLSFSFIIFNFVFAGLHARNALVLKEGYASQTFESMIDNLGSKTNLIEKIYIIEYNRYLNDIKGTYLKFAQWFYKFSFLLVLMVTFLIPPLLITLQNVDLQKNNEIELTIEPRKMMSDSTFVDSTNRVIKDSMSVE